MNSNSRFKSAPKESRRSNIELDYNDSSSSDDEDGPEVYSVHSSSSSSSEDSSELMVDYDAMWDKEVAKRQAQQRQEESGLATQPPAPSKEKKPQGTTPVPKNISTKRRTIVETPESLAMSSIGGSDKKKPAAKAPKVSLSPQKKSDANKLKPGCNVTMLEAVVMDASNAKQETVSDTTNAAPVETKKQNQEAAKSKTTKPPSDNTVISKSTDKKQKKEHVKKDSATSKPKPSSAKKERVKKDSSTAKSSSSSSEPTKKKAKKESSTTVKPVSSEKSTTKSSDAPPKTESKPSSSKKKERTKKETSTIKSSAATEPKKKKKKKESSATVKPTSSMSSAKPTAAATAASNSTKPSNATQKQTTAAKRKSPPTESSASNNPNKHQPPKKKKKKCTFQDEILYKMLMSCKPFTLKTLAQSVDSTEAAIHHVMLSLVDKQIVIKKEFTSKGGRTKELYWANQESTAKQVLALDLPSVEEMTTVQEEYASLKAKDALFARELMLVKQELSNDELDKKLVEMQAAVDEANAKIAETKQRISAASGSGGGNARILKKRINHMRDEWKKRKTKTMDFVDQLADGMEKPIKQVVKLLDLETDEMEGVTMPPKHDVS